MPEVTLLTGDKAIEIDVALIVSSLRSLDKYDKRILVEYINFIKYGRKLSPTAIGVLSVSGELLGGVEVDWVERIHSEGKKIPPLVKSVVLSLCMDGTLEHALAQQLMSGDKKVLPYPDPIKRDEPTNEEQSS